MNFLSSLLRDEGGLEYKAAIADTIITIIADNPEAKEAGDYFFYIFLLFLNQNFVGSWDITCNSNTFFYTGLAHLCEFIEDCEHTSLAVRILHLLGKEGPKTKQPSR